MPQTNKLAAALALGTALLAYGQMAMAITLHATPDIQPGYGNSGHAGIILPRDMPRPLTPGKVELAPVGKPDFAPAGNAGAMPDAKHESRHETKDDLPSDLFLLGDEGFETVEFFTGFFYASQSFEVIRAGTYELTLSDMVFPESLRKLGATVTTAQDKLTEFFGSGSMLFDMDTGTHYLSYFAKARSEYDLGLFGLTLRYYDGATTPVPAPGALWLLGSGLIGLAGIARGRKPR